MKRVSDFRQKEVVNISDGRRLGFITDVEVNLEKGLIEAIIIPGQGKFLGFMGGEGDYVIPWSDIEKIGDDVILVRVEEKYRRA